MTKEQVEEYSQNPNNFSKEEWEMLQEIRGELSGMHEEAETALTGSGATDEDKAKKAKRKQRPGKKKWLQG